MSAQRRVRNVSGDSFRSKPSDAHIIWRRETRDGAGRERFDQNRFRAWADHYGFDFETATRVDHDRASEPRQQYRCVFRWEQLAEETIEFGDDEWTLGEQRTPRTFIEIDAATAVRIRGWEFESVFDVVEMRHDGSTLLFETANGATKQLDGQAFATPPGER